MQIDPRTFEIERRFDLGGSLDSLAADDDGVWVGDALASTVRFVDPQTGKAAESIEVGSPLAAIGIDKTHGTVWAFVFE